MFEKTFKPLTLNISVIILKYDIIIQVTNIICLPCSSHTAAVLSKEHDASTWPNSGCAQVTFHTEPEWVCEMKTFNNFP